MVMRAAGWLVCVNQGPEENEDNRLMKRTREVLGAGGSFSVL